MKNILSDEKNKVTLIDTNILPKLNIPKEIIHKFNQKHNFNDSEAYARAALSMRFYISPQEQLLPVSTQGYLI